MADTVLAREGAAGGRAADATAAGGCEPAAHGQREKLAKLRGLFAEAFGKGAAGNAAGDAAGDDAAGGSFVLASAPGRLEIAGNHVDHQGGRVISGAIGQRTWGLAMANGLDCIRVVMEGFGSDVISLAEDGWAEPVPAERESSAALVRGMAALYAQAGGAVRGFDLVTCSDVPAGCGVSSSAAFEVMAGALLEGLFGKVWDGPVPLALAATLVEQRFFGKPCGAQDQLASACGGVIAMDFASEVPRVQPVRLDAAASGYELMLVDSRIDHSLYQSQFAAVPEEMFAVARFLGVERLGDVSVGNLLSHLGEAREALGDRAVMRALHFYDETARVAAQQEALEAGDFAEFLRCARLSGASSAQFLQNVSPASDDPRAPQPAMLIQALCAHLLWRDGAWRIHGGGFGGSVLAIVPAAQADDFVRTMDGCLGYEACRRMSVGGPGARSVRVDA